MLNGLNGLETKTYTIHNMDNMAFLEEALKFVENIWLERKLSEVNYLMSIIKFHLFYYFGKRNAENALKC